LTSAVLKDPNTFVDALFSNYTPANIFCCPLQMVYRPEQYRNVSLYFNSRCCPCPYFDNFTLQGGFILDMGVHFIAGLRMVISPCYISKFEKIWIRFWPMLPEATLLS